MKKKYLSLVIFCNICQLGMDKPPKLQIKTSSPRILKDQGSPHAEPSPRKEKSKVSTLACIASRCLAHRSDFLTNEDKMSLVAPSDVSCVIEVILRELIKPHIFPLELREPLNAKSVIHNGVCGLDFIPSTQEVVSGACDGRIMFSKMNELSVARGYDFNPLSLSTLSISSVKPLEIFIGSDNGTIYRMNYATKRLELPFRAHTGVVNKINIGSTILASCSTDKTVKIWEKETLKPLKTIDTFSQAVRCIELIEDENILISGSSDGKVKLWNVHSADLIKEYTYLTRPRIWGLGVMKKSKHIATALNTENSQGKVSLLDLATLQEIGQWYGHGQTISGLSCDADEKYFVTGSWDNKARLWDVRMRICAATFLGTDWVQQVKCIGNEVITGSRDKMLRLWDVRKIKEMDAQALDAKALPKIAAIAASLKNQSLLKKPGERENLLERVTTKPQSVS